MPSYCWMDGSYGSLPDGMPVRAGRDKDGSDIFVGRAWHEGDLLPAKVIPSKGGAFVAHGGSEHSKEHYEVMCDGRAAWQSASNGEIPEEAVSVGQTADGERLYFGRVMHDGALTPGKVQPSHNTCYVPYDGQEIPFSDYEVLILK